MQCCTIFPANVDESPAGDLGMSPAEAYCYCSTRAQRLNHPAENEYFECV